MGFYGKFNGAFFASWYGRSGVAPEVPQGYSLSAPLRRPVTPAERKRQDEEDEAFLLILLGGLE